MHLRHCASSCACLQGYNLNTYFLTIPSSPWSNSIFPLVPEQFISAVQCPGWKIVSTILLPSWVSDANGNRRSSMVVQNIPTKSMFGLGFLNAVQRGSLRLLETCMDVKFYVKEILGRTLLPFIWATFPDAHRFQQDNNSKHTSRLRWKNSWNQVGFTGGRCLPRALTSIP